MALQDTVTKQYMSKGEIFADAFNYLIYSGRQVIRPDQLSEMDTTQIAIPFAPQEQGKPETTQKYRDVLKTLSVKKDKTCTYLVLGIENQSRVHYAMPIRNMLYDVLQYEKAGARTGGKASAKPRCRKRGRVPFRADEGRPAHSCDYAGH